MGKVGVFLLSCEFCLGKKIFYFCLIDYVIIKGNNVRLDCVKGSFIIKISWVVEWWVGSVFLIWFEKDLY